MAVGAINVSPLAISLQIQELQPTEISSLVQERKIATIAMTHCVDCTTPYHKITCFGESPKLLYPQVTPPQLSEALLKARPHNINFYMEDTGTVKIVTSQ